MTVKIDSPIAYSEVVTADSKVQAPHVWTPFARPAEVDGTTYKVQPPIYEEALYVTINNITLDNGSLRPIELFVNSKNMQSFQWITGMTRLISALFRQPTDFTFIIEELKQVFDPHGGFFVPGSKGQQCPSVVAYLGIIIEQHCMKIGAMKKPELTIAQKEFVAAKRKEYEGKNEPDNEEDTKIVGDVKGFPESAEVCGKCHHKAVIRLDNCKTCLSCSHSHCG